MRFMMIVGVFLLGCAGSSSGGVDCETIEAEITQAAISRGLNPRGICTNPDPAIQRDFGKACASARTCS